MTKRMGIWLCITLTTTLLSLLPLAYCASRQSTGDPRWLHWTNMAAAVTGVSFLLLMGGTVGVRVIGFVLNARLRASGGRVQAVILHAQPAGMVNYRDNWALELQLPDGRRARIQLTSASGFVPGESMTVMAGRGNPARAVLPPDAARTGF